MLIKLIVATDIFNMQRERHASTHAHSHADNTERGRERQAKEELREGKRSERAIYIELRTHAYA